MFAAVGGGELMVCELEITSTSFSRSSVKHSLSTLFAASLGPSLSSISNLNRKQANTVHFVSDDKVIVSFVDLHPTGQSSIL
jgi:hypothetical protein